MALIKENDISVWYPETEGADLAHRQSVSFLTFCRARKPVGAFGNRDDFTFESMQPWLGNLMVLEYDTERDDFRYRIYGSEIAFRSGFDLTGKWVSDFNPSIGAIYHAQYSKALDEKCLIVSRSPYFHSRALCDWERVICPMLRGDRRQLVVSNHMVELTGALRQQRELRLKELGISQAESA